MLRDLEREPGHLVSVLRSSELVNRVKEDQQRPLLGGKLEQLLEVGRDGDCVVRNVLTMRKFCITLQDTFIHIETFQHDF